jgi:hypothetical protein
MIKDKLRPQKLSVPTSPKTFRPQKLSSVIKDKLRPQKLSSAFYSDGRFDTLFTMKLLNTLLGLVSVFLTGCLTSQEPFALPNEKQSDDRLPGTYLNDDGKLFFDIAERSEETGKYPVAVFGGDVDNARCSYSLVGTLFQIGTNRFLDLVPKLQACDYVPGNPPGLIEILQAVTLQPLHMVVKVHPGTNELKFAVATREGLSYAAERYPELFSGGELPRMRPNTKNQREFLLKMGGDTNVFPPTMAKRQKD